MTENRGLAILCLLGFVFAAQGQLGGLPGMLNVPGTTPTTPKTALPVPAPPGGVPLPGGVPQGASGAPATGSGSGPPPPPPAGAPPGPGAPAGGLPASPISLPRLGNATLAPTPANSVLPGGTNKPARRRRDADSFFGKWGLGSLNFKNFSSKTSSSSNGSSNFYEKSSAVQGIDSKGQKVGEERIMSNVAATNAESEKKLDEFEGLKLKQVYNGTAVSEDKQRMAEQTKSQSDSKAEIGEYLGTVSNNTKTGTESPSA